MKNFLIVIAMLGLCFVIAVTLVLWPPLNGNASQRHHTLGAWTAFDDSDETRLMVQIGDDRIIVNVPVTKKNQTTYQRHEEEGHWDGHAFYCDSHLDAPPEIIVATELKNEDVELDANYFVPQLPKKVTCVMSMRQIFDDFPYPVNVPGKKVAYPPPKGMIRPGMLECDLEVIAWSSDKVEIASNPIPYPHTTTLSDGSRQENYFTSGSPEPGSHTSVYHYHSDRPGVPELLVTVYHGRVIRVDGGAEQTADAPFRFPPKSGSAEIKDQGWGGWFFDSVFRK